MEAGETASERFMGDTGILGGDTDGGDTVDGHVHRPPAGNSSTSGVPTTTLGGLHVVKML